MTTYALAQAFKEKGLLKVWGAVPTDNRLALLAARHIGMRQEGVLTQAIVREEGGLRDLVLFGLTKEQFLAGQPPPRKRLNGAHP
jgi:RimJ/RimL family protein N-acetyltransferase